MWVLIVVVFMILVTPFIASAQEDSNRHVALDIMKSVALDPTTYAPAVLSYTSQKADWNSSQALFNAGWVEHNYRYTVSGRPDDRPVSYGEGNRLIMRDAYGILGQSLLNNFAANLFERSLTQRFPEHRTLFKTLSWAERIGFSSYVGYLASADHFRQVTRNQQMARTYGLQ